MSYLRGFCHYFHRGDRCRTARLQNYGVQKYIPSSPPSIKRNVLRESLSVDSQNIPSETLERERGNLYSSRSLVVIFSLLHFSRVRKRRLWRGSQAMWTCPQVKWLLLLIAWEKTCWKMSKSRYIPEYRYCLILRFSQIRVQLNRDLYPAICKWMRIRIRHLASYVVIHVRFLAANIRRIWPCSTSEPV